MEETPLLWGVFIAFVLGALILDLGILNRRTHTLTVRQATFWCLVWSSLALLFCLGLYFKLGPDHALSFLAGYVVELSLSVDNLFVFIMIFEFFKVNPKYQHKILFWGIIGAVFFRALFIGTGLTLIHYFEWVLYLLGLLLIFIGIKMAIKSEENEAHPEKSFIIKLLKKILPLTETAHNDKFFVRQNGKLLGTPLFLVLVAIETSDIVFALDSIPAVIAISRDPFIVFTSNIFAILGLRAMYFLIAGAMSLFHYLNIGVGLILVLVGIKMLISEHYQVPIVATLGIMIFVIGVSITLSLLKPKPPSE